MLYHDGLISEGVVTAPPKVYVVFWGSQWGADTVSSAGYDTFPATSGPTWSGDPSLASGYVEALLRGLGTNGETWDGVIDQYCGGPNVALGDQTCPAGSTQIPYPGTGGMFAGSWYDGNTPAPAEADGEQIADEATKAAAYFNNTTRTSNVGAIYVVMSPEGTNPDNYENQPPNHGFCAWHDSTLSTNIGLGLPSGGVPTPYGALNFIDMPYVSDMLSSCGAGFVNHPNNTLDPQDGFSIVLGHEIAETLTDPRSNTGWNGPGGEIGDKCAWIISPTYGSNADSADITLTPGGTTKAFAMQSLWSNHDDACEISDQPGTTA